MTWEVGLSINIQLHSKHLPPLATLQGWRWGRSFLQCIISVCTTKKYLYHIVSLLKNTLSHGIWDPQRERGYAALLNVSYQWDYQMHISNMSISSENPLVTHAASVALGLLNPFLLLHLIVGVGLSNYGPILSPYTSALPIWHLYLSDFGQRQNLQF